MHSKLDPSSFEENLTFALVLSVARFGRLPISVSGGTVSGLVKRRGAVTLGWEGRIGFRLGIGWGILGGGGGGGGASLAGIVTVTLDGEPMAASPLGRRSRP